MLRRGNNPTGGSTMNARITTIALAILTGTITASGHPQQRRQKPQQRRPNPAFGQQEQRCPACGAPQQQPQQRKQPQRQDRERPQFQDRGQNPPRQFSPQQRQNMQQMHRQILQRYDRDGDGRLSERERQAVKRALMQGGREQHGSAKKPKKQKQPDQQKRRNRPDPE